MITAREAAILVREKQAAEKAEEERYASSTGRANSPEYNRGMEEARRIADSEMAQLIEANARLGRKRCSWASEVFSHADNKTRARLEGIVMGLTEILNLHGYRFRVEIEEVGGILRIKSRIAWDGESP
jgi:hypothetical protein